MLQRQRLEITYNDYLVELDQAPSRANILSYATRVQLVAAMAGILADERIPRHTRDTVRRLKEEFNELTKTSAWNAAAAKLSLLVDQVNLIPVHEPKQIVHREAHAGDIVAPGEMAGACEEMITAFPLASVTGTESGGSIVIVRDDPGRRSHRLAPGHAEVDLGPRCYGLRIDIQGGHNEDKGGGKNVRCVRFAIQHGGSTYSSMIVESQKDFGSDYLKRALRESMEQRTQAHVYMD